mgnify:CR=1 FL=1
MSDFQVRVVRTPKLERQPGTDRLLRGEVNGFPVTVAIDSPVVGASLAVFIPVDSVVPDKPEFAFLKGDFHIRAARRRGLFSMGLLWPAPPDTVEGQDVAEMMGIARHEPKDPAGGDNERDGGYMPRYTDIENFRQWHHVLIPGEEVVATEKIHGQCWRARYAAEENRLVVGSFEVMKKRDAAQSHWAAALTYGLEDKLRAYPDFAIYGEVLGTQKGYRYGRSEDKPDLRLFDVMDAKKRVYLDYDDAVRFAADIAVPMVPLLYRGPYDHDVLVALGEGPSTIHPEHVREGFVVKRAKESWDEHIQRVLLKYHGQGFLLKKK